MTPDRAAQQRVSSRAATPTGLSHNQPASSPASANSGKSKVRPPMNQERFYKLGEVQQMLGVSRSTVWRWTAENGLKVVRVGSVARIRESDLQAFLGRHETDGAKCADLPQADVGRIQSA